MQETSHFPKIFKDVFKKYPEGEILKHKFELPVIVFLLTKIGIITPKFLSTTRKYAAVIILIIAAFITPSPDWYSQALVFIPLYTLFEFSIIVSRWAHKSVKKEDEEWD